MDTQDAVAIAALCGAIIGASAVIATIIVIRSIANYANKKRGNA